METNNGFLHKSVLIILPGGSDFVGHFLNA